MKDLIRRLEHSHEFWLVTSLSVIFFLLRLPSLFEPNWYGDEGIYQTIGLALDRGRILYTQIWDNKPPLLYYTYAVVQNSQFAIRFLSLIVGIASVITFFILARTLFRQRNASAIATGIFVLLFGLPMFEGNIANAENFMLLPIIIAGLLIYLTVGPSQNKSQKPQTLNSKYLVLAGILLGIAFLYKIVAVFDFAAFFIFFVITTFGREFSVKKILTYLFSFWKVLGLFIISFLIPFILSIIYFLLHKEGLNEYIRAIFLSTVGYVGYKNAFIIPQGLLISKIILLVIFSFILFIKRQKIKLDTLFILLWTAFSLFNSFFSQRPYTHYLLVLIPAFSLLVGKIYLEKKGTYLRYAAITLLLGFIALQYFDHWSFSKTARYYKNFIGFTTGNTPVNAYNSFFDRRTLRDTAIIQYINTHKKDDSTLFVWGNDAQIYPLTNTIPPGRFTVAYHIAGIKPYEKEIGAILKKNPPTYLVVLNDVTSYPFPLYNYQQVISIQNADIYERTD